MFQREREVIHFWSCNLEMTMLYNVYEQRGSLDRSEPLLCVYCKIKCIRQITRLPKKVSPPDRGGES